MCNCNKPLVIDDCARLKAHHDHEETFIYHITPKGELKIAHVPKGINPNDIARSIGYYNVKGEIEWFNTSEHPCSQ